MQKWAFKQFDKWDIDMIKWNRKQYFDEAYTEIFNVESIKRDNKESLYPALNRFRKKKQLDKSITI